MAKVTSFSLMAVPGLVEFLRDYPGMAIRPRKAAELVLSGRFAFSAQSGNGPTIIDDYELSVLVPSVFPNSLPEVTEVARKIPRNGHHHVNPDGTLCLGSPLRLLLQLSKSPTLTGFAENCLVPYLYAISHRLIHGGPLPFSELEHGTPGLLNDYASLFSLKNPEQAKLAFQMLAMKKRRANKLPCPCGCKKRLGKCSFNLKLALFRKLASRSWFRSQQL